MHENPINISQTGNFFVIGLPDYYLQHIVIYEWYPDVFDEKGLICPQSDRR